MNREINIRLNANRAKAVHTGHKFASGDKGIVFRIAVDELDTTGTTAKIVFKRSNGTSVEAGITGTEGVYSYTTLGNEFAVVGPVTADVKFYEKENRVSTCTFVFDVTSDTLDGIGAGTAGYSDTLERMKKSMEQAEADILAAKDELENRAEEILQQMTETAESAEEDVETAEQKMVDLSADLEALYQEYVDAFGSTGPFNPRGPYSETETYTVRDMVTHNDASWVCYRNCTGETPSKESDCWQYLAAGDAKTLDGHGAEYFAKAEINLGEINILESELDTLVKDYGISNGVTYTASIRPKASSDGKYIFGGVNFGLIGMEYGNNTQGFQFGMSGSLIKMRRLNSGTWGEWKTLATTADLANYLPKTGGEIDSNNFYPLMIDNNAQTHSMVAFKSKNTMLGSLGFVEKDKAQMWTSDGGQRELLHTGNKPTGTYTGNGSADTRYFSIQGVGKELVIYSDNGVVFVFNKISVWISSDGTVSIVKGRINYDGTTLGFYSDSPLLNASGVQYTYRVL